MEGLKNLADRLDDPSYCRYSIDGTYPVKEGDHITLLNPQELLTVGRTHPTMERVMIAYFGDNPTRVLYVGENNRAMLQTLQALKIPKTPTNLGETVFKIFRQHLEEDQDKEKPFSLELKVHSGDEHQFRTILRKLIHVYSGREIDADFYAAL